MVQTGMTVPEFVNCCHAVRYLVDAREFDLPESDISDDSGEDKSLWQTVNLPVHLF